MMNVQIKGFCSPKGMKLHRSKALALFMNLIRDTRTGDFFSDLYCIVLTMFDTQIFLKKPKAWVEHTTAIN